jgi:hypothetical protein
MKSVTVVDPGTPYHAKQMLRLAEFCGADRITYKDGGDREDYILEKDGDVLELKVRGNRVDGAFLSIDVEG